MKKNINHLSLDTIFILILLCVFAMSSMLIMAGSINAYEKISEKSNESFDNYTPLAYVATKIRQNDSTGFINFKTVSIKNSSSGETDTIEAIVLNDYDGDCMCSTWIYNYENNICEQYIDADTEFEPDDGMIIFNDNSLYYKLEDNLIKITNLNNQQIPTTIYVNFRSHYATGELGTGGKTDEN